MADLSGKRILAIVTNYGIEQDELLVPVRRLRDDGVEVVVAAQHAGEIVTLVGDRDAGETTTADTTIADADGVEGFDLLLVPGGSINADTLRTDDDAVSTVRSFVDAAKPIAAICHAPWTLIEAGAVEGKNLTSYPSLKTDIVNAGGTWHDESVFVCPTGGWTLITSRTPDDLDDFVGAIEEQLSA